MALTEKDRNDRVDQIMDAVDYLFTARLQVEKLTPSPSTPGGLTPEELGVVQEIAEAELDEAKAELRRVLLYAVR